MKRYRIFVSSAQKELHKERQAIKRYIESNVLFKRYFEVFLFEDLPAQDRNPQNLYLKEVGQSDIYLGLLGNQYGKPGADGFSPTEEEFRRATKLGKERLIYVKRSNDDARDPRVQKLVTEAGSQLIRKRFNNILHLEKGVYDSLIEFLSKKGKIPLPEFDSAFDPEAGYRDINENLVRKFLDTRAMKLKTTIPQITVKDFLLKTVGIVKKIGKKLQPNNTAILFFCDHPQKYIPQSSIKIARYKGPTRLRTLDSCEIEGDLYSIIDKDVQAFFIKNTHLAGKIVGFKRIDIPEYPFEAIREAVINAIAHRDYDQRGANVQIEIFDDRIEVTSPGGILPGLDIKRLEGIHKTRNREICKIFHETRDMERFGTGIMRMKHLMKDQGLKPPTLSEKGDFFRVTFYGPGENILDLASNIPEDMQIDLRGMGLNDRQIKALELMVNEKKIMTNRLYRKSFNVTDRTALRDLNLLLKMELVKKEGFKKDAIYKAV